MSVERAPARAEHHVVHGLSVTRRRHEDISDERSAVILVHGAMDRAASFGRVMRRLGSHDVVAYDRRGYGGSGSGAVGVDLAGHVEDLRRVIDWTGARSVLVVGHSLGGTIALRLAEHTAGRAEHPTKGSGGAQPDDEGSITGTGGDLVGLAAFEFPVPGLHGSYASVGSGAIEVAEADGDEAGAEHFYRTMVGERVWTKLRERDKQARRAEGPALISELVDLRNPSSSPELETIGTPVLVGIGSASSTRLSGTAVDAASILPRGALHVIDGAGHGAHMSHPDAFARYVLAAIEHAGIVMPDISGSR